MRHEWAGSRPIASQPYSSPAMDLRDALAAHYAAHGLPADGGATDAWFRVRLGRLIVPLPNPPARRRALFLHDANHVLTGYDTRFGGGEVMIAAFEVGAGCGPYLMAWAINLPMLVIGGVLRPVDVLRAFARGRHSRSIYREPDARAALECMRVTELRKRLMLDRPAPTPTFRDAAAFAIWSGAALLAMTSIIALVAVPLWLTVRTVLAAASLGASVAARPG